MPDGSIKPALPDAEAVNQLATSLPLSAEKGRLRIKALASGAELILFGEVGFEITAAGVFAVLGSIDAAAPLTVRINSPGGSVFEGLAIYNALARRPGQVTVVVEGIAASAASLIAMAGREIIMGAGTFLMIHDPSGLAAGTADVMRELASFLDRVRDAMVPIYANRSGQPEATVKRLMDDETWFTAEEAVAQGFADRVETGHPITARFDLSRFHHVPAAAPRAAPAPSTEITMSTTTTPTSTDAASVELLKQIAAKAQLGPDFVVAQLAAKATMQAATEAAWEHLVARSPQRPAAHASNEQLWGPDTRGAITAMEGALIARITGSAAQGPARDYMGTPMAEMARECLEMTGTAARRWPIQKVVASAMQTTSDFPALLERVARKTLLDAYRAAQSPLATILARPFVSASGDRKIRVIRAPEFPQLDEILEHEEIKRSGSPEDKGEGFSIRQFAKIVALTEEAIRQDYLGGFAQMINGTAKAATETEARQVLAVLTANAGMGVSLFDGRPLFDASRGNAGTGTLSVASLKVARQAMRRTRSLDGETLVSVTPKYLVVGPELETEAEQVLAQLSAVSAPAEVNPFSGKLTPVVEPRLEGTAWYLFADPAEAPILGVAYFDGEQGPRVDTRTGWDVLGLEVRTVLDVGAGAIGWRGAYRSTGQ